MLLSLYLAISLLSPCRMQAARRSVAPFASLRSTRRRYLILNKLPMLSFYLRWIFFPKLYSLLGIVSTADEQRQEWQRRTLFELAWLVGCQDPRRQRTDYWGTRPAGGRRVENQFDQLLVTFPYPNIRTYIRTFPFCLLICTLLSYTYTPLALLLQLDLQQP